jgi:hypothetical protein
VSRQAEPARLDVAAAIEHGALRTTKPVHRAAENPTIDSIALISRPEQARRVAPRAAVVIAGGQEASGWLVSSVLRYAWERRASVVVAAGAQPDSVLVLAQRLDITLLFTDGDPTDLALALAADIGAANAAVEAQLIALMRLVIAERTIDGILRTASAELGALPLELTFRGAVVAAAGPSDRTGRLTLGPLPVAGAAGDQVELAAYPLRSAGPQAFAESALNLVIPSLRAVWFEMESSDRLDGLASAAASSAAVSAGAGDQVRPQPEPAPSRPALLQQLGWRDDDSHFVVFLRPADERNSRALSNVVRLIWRRAMGQGSLVEAPNGWLTVLSTDDEAGAATALGRLRSQLSPALAELGIGVGLSSVERSPDRLNDLVTEARLAARCAWAVGPGEVAVFDDLQLSAIGSLFDPADARTIARLVLPEFCAAPDLDRLVESVAAFLDAGSVIAAAAELSVHRNTLTARLDRARALGLPVGEPSLAFAVAAVVRAFHPAPSPAPHRPPTPGTTP